MKSYILPTLILSLFIVSCEAIIDSTFPRFSCNIDNEEYLTREINTVTDDKSGIGGFTITAYMYDEGLIMTLKTSEFSIRTYEYKDSLYPDCLISYTDSISHFSTKSAKIVLSKVNKEGEPIREIDGSFTAVLENDKGEIKTTVGSFENLVIYD